MRQTTTRTHLSTLVLVLLTVAVNWLMWGVVNTPYHVVDTTYPFRSLSFNPYGKDESPFDEKPRTAEQIQADVQPLIGKTKALRIYSARYGLEQTPAIAKPYGMTVIAGAQISDGVPSEVIDEEIEAAIRLAGRHRNVTHLILGNETQLHKILSREELVRYLRTARERLKTPVSTAEPWDFWINNPEVVDEVDFIAIHILPYWLGVPIDDAVRYVFDHYQAVKMRFPNKMVMIAETGWPSDGPQRDAAVASLTNQARFVREFVREATARKLNYNIIEAFDQPWKSRTEGRAGEHWGVLNADRREKFPFSGPVLEDPKWKYWALASCVLGFFSASLLLFRRPRLRLPGQLLTTVIVQLAAALATQLAREATNEYLSPGDIAFWSVMITAQVLLAIILITDTVEIADVVGYDPLEREFPPVPQTLTHPPMVSIHLACCREPPDMVIATIDSLAALDYPNVEVLVIDNNTPDDALWKPIEAHCARLGTRFRFFHLPNVSGFKAGALNFALRQTHPDAQIVGVVDADYIVAPGWLAAAVPYFVADPNVAHVQAPQEHRGWDSSVFQRMENDEYSGFFRIGMVQRNEDNAIIQHGTMTLIDRRVMDQLGGWAEWCICEDTELGLRILNRGKSSVYLNHAFGHGLVPDSYEAYAKQRFRWAYGGMRILRHYWRWMCGWDVDRLTSAQRYQFVKGWLPWVGDALHLLFTATALLWSVVLLADPLHTDFPEPIFVYPALLLVALRISGTFWTYRARVKIGTRRTLLALIAGGSLTHKIAKAVWQGLLGFEQPFYRTPKMANVAPIINSLMTVREEVGLAVLLWAAAIAVLISFGFVNWEAMVWAFALMIHSFPYLAAIGAAVVASLPERK